MSGVSRELADVHEMADVPEPLVGKSKSLTCMFEPLLGTFEPSTNMSEPVVGMFEPLVGMF